MMEKGSNNVAPVDTEQEKEHNQKLMLYTVTSSSSSVDEYCSLSLLPNCPSMVKLKMYNTTKIIKNIWKKEKKINQDHVRICK